MLLGWRGATVRNRDDRIYAANSLRLIRLSPGRQEA